MKITKEMIEKEIEETKRMNEEMEANGDFYDDIDILFVENIEDDLIQMVKSGMPKGLFKVSCENLLGEDWEVDGLNILRANAPELIKKFNEYCDVD